MVPPSCCSTFAANSTLVCVPGNQFNVVSGLTPMAVWRAVCVWCWVSPGRAVTAASTRLCAALGTSCSEHVPCGWLVLVTILKPASQHITPVTCHLDQLLASLHVMKCYCPLEFLIIRIAKNLVVLQSGDYRLCRVSMQMSKPGSFFTLCAFKVHLVCCGTRAFSRIGVWIALAAPSQRGSCYTPTHARCHRGVAA